MGFYLFDYVDVYNNNKVLKMITDKIKMKKVIGATQRQPLKNKKDI